jgi:hypothetical protein
MASSRPLRVDRLGVVGDLRAFGALKVCREARMIAGGESEHHAFEFVLGLFTTVIGHDVEEFAQCDFGRAVGEVGMLRAAGEKPVRCR